LARLEQGEGEETTKKNVENCGGHEAELETPTSPIIQILRHLHHAA
jgi:hypothetical protein